MSRVVENKLVQIEEVTNDDGLFCDGDWIESKDQDPLGSVRLIQLADIGDGFFIDKSLRYVNQETSHRLKCTHLKKGDILVSRLPDPLGRCCIFPLEGKYITAVDVCIIRVNTNCSNTYTSHMINSPEIRNEIWRLRSGTTRQRITRKKLGKLKIPLPPLEEQKRIVAKIDTLFAKIDKAISRTEDSLKQAENLLPSLLKEVFDKGKADGWEEKKVGEVLDNILTGTTPSKREPKYYENPTVNWFSPSDFGVVKVLEDAKNKVSQLAIDERKAKLYEKDSLLLVAIGATVGKVGIIRKKVSSNQQITALKFMPHLNVEFTYYYFLYIKPIVVKTASAATLPIINQKTIKSLSIIFPSLLAQKDLVSRFNNISKISNKTQSKLEEQLSYLKQLKSSIFSKAFKGEL